MGLSYKVNVLDALKEKGYSTYKLRHDRLIGESQLQQIREGVIVSPACLEKLCRLLACQPGDLLRYEADDEKGQS